jgi:hypothetical protein
LKYLLYSLIIGLCFISSAFLVERDTYEVTIDQPMPISGDCSLTLQVTSCGQKPLKGGTLVLWTDRGRKIKLDLNKNGLGKVNYCMLKHNFPVEIMKIASSYGDRADQGTTERRFWVTEGLEYLQVTDSTFMYRTDTDQYYYSQSSKESIIKAKLVYRGYKLRGDHLSFRRHRNSFDMKPQLLKQFLKGNFRLEGNTLIFNLSICT